MRLIQSIVWLYVVCFVTTIMPLHDDGPRTNAAASAGDVERRAVVVVVIATTGRHGAARRTSRRRTSHVPSPQWTPQRYRRHLLWYTRANASCAKRVFSLGGRTTNRSTDRPPQHRVAHVAYKRLSVHSPGNGVEKQHGQIHAFTLQCRSTSLHTASSAAKESQGETKGKQGRKGSSTMHTNGPGS